MQKCHERHKHFSKKYIFGNGGDKRSSSEMEVGNEMVTKHGGCTYVQPSMGGTHAWQKAGQKSVLPP